MIKQQQQPPKKHNEVQGSCRFIAKGSAEKILEIIIEYIFIYKYIYIHIQIHIYD